MSTNPYFHKFEFQNEKDLLESLVIEAVQINGVLIRYIPRELVNEDKLLGEDPLSIFTTAFDLEMYVESYVGFDGRDDFLSKFGVVTENQLKLICSTKRFSEEIPGRVRALEGDLIYFPLTGNIFEIKFVEDKVPFFQMGACYTFGLSCELFEYSHERVSTGNIDIDKIQKNNAYAVDLIIDTDSGSGNYESREIVYQGSDLANANAKGFVVLWDDIAGLLRINDVVGEFINNANIIGNTSAAVYQLASFDDLEFPTDAGATNEFSEEKVIDDNIIDLSENSPFGRF